MSFDHARAKESFSALWDGELPPDEAAALEAHLASCDECRAEYEGFKRAMSSVAGLKAKRADANITDGVIDRLRRRSGGRLFGPRRLVERIPYELVSLLMLALVVAIYLWFEVGRPSRIDLP